jgi:hypothetical protein
VTVAVQLTTGFVECLLLVLALDAVRSGRRLYIVAAVGLGAVLLARMADGFMPGVVIALLRLGGLALAGIILAIDLLFEEVVVEEDTEPRRIRP